MPFPMVHLFVAHDLAITEKIDNLSQFYLGILAPDSYYHRKDYSFEDRKISHLTVDDINRWQDNTICFIEQHKHDPQKWFYIGYGVHILTDIYWDDIIYKPFLHSYSQSKEASHSNPRQLYRSDMTMIDLWLYRTCEFKNDVWLYLSQGKGIDIQGLVTSSEIDNERDSTLIWYDEKKDQITDNFKYTIPKQVTAFIQKSIKEIDAQLSCIL